MQKIMYKLNLASFYFEHSSNFQPEEFDDLLKKQ
jgi:hypothetical protein